MYIISKDRLQSSYEKTELIFAIKTLMHRLYRFETRIRLTTLKSNTNY